MWIQIHSIKFIEENKMKKLQVISVVILLSLSAEAFATGSKREPPQALSLFEQIANIFNFS